MTTGEFPTDFLSTIFSKVFEGIIHDRLFKFLEKLNLIIAHQYGLIKKRSTFDAILNFCGHCYSSFESKNFQMSVFLDLSKALNTIDHDILCNKIGILRPQRYHK